MKGRGAARIPAGPPPPPGTPAAGLTAVQRAGGERSTARPGGWMALCSCVQEGRRDSPGPGQLGPWHRPSAPCRRPQHYPSPGQPGVAPLTPQGTCPCATANTAAARVCATCKGLLGGLTEKVGKRLYTSCASHVPTQTEAYVWTLHSAW